MGWRWGTAPSVLTDHSSETWWDVWHSYPRAEDSTRQLGQEHQNSQCYSWRVALLFLSYLPAWIQQSSQQQKWAQRCWDPGAVGAPPFLHIGAAAPRVPWLLMGACEPPSEEENSTRSVRLGHLLSLQRTWFRYWSVRFWAGGSKQGVPGLSKCWRECFRQKLHSLALCCWSN